MSEPAALTILGLMTLAINYVNIMLVFPCRFNMWVSVSLPLIFTTGLYAALLLTETINVLAGGFRGFIHLPLVMLLVRGQVFQILFCFISQMMLSGFGLVSAKLLAELFADAKSEEFYLFYVIFALIFYAIYVFLVYKFGRKFASKLFIDGRSSEWAAYSLGALFSLTVFAVTVQTVTHTGLYILLMVFTFWSFCILCFAIINTHEKTKQRYNAEFARNIISTGRGHYQKMNEMYDKLRILRHDYKYHLSATREMLRSGDSEGVDNYLTDVETELAQYDFLPNYCPNPVINALVAGYAERCTKLNIRFGVDIFILRNLPVPNYELCIIIGNLLENAVEACEKLDNGRVIELAAKSTPAQFMLMIKNSFDGTVSPGEGERTPVSLKPNGGVGLQSVKAVAVRYDGDLFTKWDKSTFTAYITVKL